MYARVLDLARGVQGVREGYFPFLAAGYGAGLLLTFAALWLHVGGDQVHTLGCTCLTLLAGLSQPVSGLCCINWGAETRCTLLVWCLRGTATLEQKC